MIIMKTYKVKKIFNKFPEITNRINFRKFSNSQPECVYTVKSSISANRNFFYGGREFCVFEKGIPGDPEMTTWQIWTTEKLTHTKSINK